MNTTNHQPNSQSGFSIAEVTLAIGVVAFGLVAVLGVLPVGLTVQKDNREETIIRYDAQYWMTVLRAGMQPTDALHQVEWVELQVDDGSSTNVYRAHRPRLSGDGFDGVHDGGLMALYNGHLKQTSWPTDVIGWMSIPDNGTALGSVKKTARVRAMNGQLFDRIYGRKVLVATKQEFMSEGDTAFHPLPGGEFAFSYLLETQIAPDPANANLYRITLTFKWPVLDDPTLKDSTKNAGDVKTVSTKSFTTLVGAPPEMAYPREYFNQGSPERRIFDVTLPGEVITLDEIMNLTGLDMIHNEAPPISRLRILRTLEKMKIDNLAEDISEPEAERDSPGMARPEDKWRIGRIYYTHGYYSLRPMTGALPQGGYTPNWGLLGNPERLRGFKMPPLTNSYFNTFYFFTPDYQ